jgi:DNA-binding NarL/FixJ family response regulator
VTDGGAGPGGQGSGAGVTRVVVVEDQPDIASALRELVEADGTAVVVAVCHTLAIGSEMVQRFRPDVVLTDFRLPDGDAVEQFAAWRVFAPATRIVVASAWTDDRSLRRAMAAGASGYVEKGQQLMELSGVIARVMAGETVWSASPPARPGAVPSPAAAHRQSDGAPIATAPRSVAQQVLSGVLAEQSTDEMAAELGLSAIEVRQHVNLLLRAAGVRTRAALRDRHGAGS